MIFNILSLIGLGVLFYILGYGISYITLKKDQYKSHYWNIAPLVGFAIFSLLIFIVSANCNLDVKTSGYISLSFLLFLTFFSLYRDKENFKDHIKNFTLLFLYSIPVVLLSLWAVVVQGFDNYFGTVNFDFYQSLSYVKILSEQNINVFTLTEPIIGTLAEVPYPSALQARFGATVIAVMLNQLFNVEYKEALMLIVSFSTLLYYYAMILFTELTFKLKKYQTVVIALITASSAPLIMSYFHIFVGQNTSLGLFLILIVLSWDYLKLPNFKQLILIIILFNALIWIYSPLIPYTIAIIGILALIYALKNKQVKDYILLPIITLLLSIIVFRINIIDESKQFIVDFIDLIGRMAQSHYYLDYLTETFFTYMLGLSAYTFGQSILSDFINDYVLLLITFLALIGYIISIIHFFRNKLIENDSKIFMYTLLGIFFFSYIQLTFVSKYGYGLFKLIVWFQFVVTPFIVYGFMNISQSKINKYVIKPVLLITIILSVFNGIDYGIKTFQNLPTKYNKIINGYGISNNDEFTELEQLLENRIPKNSKIALNFPGSIENFYYSYKLKDHNISLLSHELLPDEDAFLPDFKTKLVYDSFGLQHYYSGNPYFRENNEYYITNSKDYNFDIINNPIKGKPFIKAKTYSVFDDKQTSEIFYTGRGFYRPEQSKDLPWYWPNNTRWSAEGGEFYLLKGKKNKPYSISSFVFVGYGNSSIERSLILYHNGEQIDEVNVIGSGRIMFKPFISNGKLDKLIIKIKEKVNIESRSHGLYNTNLPRESRKLNCAFGDVSLFSDNTVKPIHLSSFSIKEFLKVTHTYNGINPDGWIHNRFETDILLSKKTSKLKLNVYVPGNYNFTIPYKILVSINDETHNIILNKIGDNIIELKYKEASNIHLALKPAQINEIKNDTRSDIKSILVKNLIFQ